MYMPEGCKVKLTIYIYSFIIPQYDLINILGQLWKGETTLKVAVI